MTPFDAPESAIRAPNISDRLLEIDALRGIAAVMVVLFHYTTRFGVRYGHIEDPGWGVPWGWLGVNLFFMISGFVIFMTLDRTRHPFDFLLSRFSRLYPAYWVAVAVTTAVVAYSNLPGKTTGPLTVLANMLMFHGLFGIKDVDSVYWSLEVELLFYAIMLSLWIAGWLKRPLLSLSAWLGLQLLYAVAQRFAGVSLPYTLSHMLVLPYIPYFGVGMIVYLSKTQRGIPAWQLSAVVLLALGVIALGSGTLDASVAAGFGSLVYVAAHGTLPVLRHRVLVWFGAISYPLYLLHENIGWSVLLLLEEAGCATNLAIAFAAATAITLAATLHYAVEMPAMRGVRHRYHAWRAQRAGAHGDFGRRRWLAGVAAALLVVNAAGRGFQLQSRPDVSGASSVATVQPARTVAVPCQQAGDPAPKVLLVLGQSNAGNHGSERNEARIRVFYRGHCYDSTEPLPGMTGEGGSIWSRLAPSLEMELHVPVILAPLAVESTTIAAWTDKGPVHEAFRRLLDDLVAARLTPDAILWQQGKSDVRLGTDAREYEQSFRKLVADLRARRLDAPVFVARSSHCRDQRNGYMHRLQTRLPHSVAGVYVGADTDSLPETLRVGGCHFRHCKEIRVSIL